MAFFFETLLPFEKAASAITNRVGSYLKDYATIYAITKFQ